MNNVPLRPIQHVFFLYSLALMGRIYTCLDRASTMQLLTSFSGPAQLSVASVQYSMRLAIILTIHILVQNGTHIKGSLKLIRMHGFMYNIVIRLHIQTLLTHTTKPSSAGNQGFGWNTNTCLCMKPLFAS